MDWLCITAVCSPVDCELGPWKFGACSQACVGSRCWRVDTREVITPATPGGKECDEEDMIRTERCTKDPETPAEGSNG